MDKGNLFTNWIHRSNKCPQASQDWAASACGACVLLAEKLLWPKKLRSDWLRHAPQYPMNILVSVTKKLELYTSYECTHWLEHTMQLASQGCHKYICWHTQIVLYRTQRHLERNLRKSQRMTPSSAYCFSILPKMLQMQNKGGSPEGFFKILRHAHHIQSGTQWSPARGCDAPAEPWNAFFIHSHYCKHWPALIFWVIMF